MKNRHMLSLLQSGFTTIHVAFASVGVPAPAPQPMPRAPGAPAPATRPWAEGHDLPTPAWASVPQRTTYAYKTRDLNTKPGDRVVVERNGALVIADVLVVDPVARIDVDADFDYKWIVQRIDFTDYKREQEAEVQFADMLQSVERERQREELVKSMTAHLEPGTVARALFDNAMSKFSTQATIAVQHAQATCETPATAPAGDGLGMQCR